MHRIAELDIPRRLSGAAPSWLSKLACAFLGVGLAVILRNIMNVFAPGVAPYAFVYPACLLATLLGGWQSGAVTLAISGTLAWVFVVPQAAAAGAQMHYQLAAAAIAAFTGSAIIAVGEGVRAAARGIVKERDAKLAERELLFRELQHRVGNDFAIVTSLLDMQRRRSNEPETRNALEQAMSRIRSIARIHHQIYALPETTHVNLRDYLQDLCNGLVESTLPPAGMSLTFTGASAYMMRDNALAIGLALNELITNAVKHAFPEGRDGRIEVHFTRTKDGWRLLVQDDGVGIAQTERKAGLGTGLIDQFVQRTGGRLALVRENGTRASIDFPSTVASSEPPV